MLAVLLVKGVLAIRLSMIKTTVKPKVSKAFQTEHQSGIITRNSKILWLSIHLIFDLITTYLFLMFYVIIIS